jgi:hypothetical protein
VAGLLLAVDALVVTPGLQPADAQHMLLVYDLQLIPVDQIVVTT